MFKGTGGSLRAASGIKTEEIKGREGKSFVGFDKKTYTKSINDIDDFDTLITRRRMQGFYLEENICRL